jgi:hypothetical protein
VGAAEVINRPSECKERGSPVRLHIQTKHHTSMGADGYNRIGIIRKGGRATQRPNPPVSRVRLPMDMAIFLMPKGCQGMTGARYPSPLSSAPRIFAPNS